MDIHIYHRVFRSITMKQVSLTPLIGKYIFGLLCALVLSGMAYVIVVERWFESNAITMTVLLLLAALQLFIQLVCFLHLGMNDRSRTRTFTIVFTLIMMLVIVVGSLWVMRNLDYRMGMSGEAMNEYMIEQNKKGF